MDGIGAVGGMAMGAGAAMGAAAPLNFGGLSGAGGQNGLQGLSTIKMQQLTELLDGFSSAEILMALMLAAASGKKKKDDDGGLALLAGLAMAQQLGQGGGMNFGGLDLGPSTGGTGALCNVLA